MVGLVDKSREMNRQSQRINNCEATHHWSGQNRNILYLVRGDRLPLNSIVRPLELCVGT